MSIALQYTKKVKEKLHNYWASWPPNSAYNVGDVGVLNGAIFEKIANLENLKIAFQTGTDKSVSTIDYVSESGVTIELKIIGEKNINTPLFPMSKAGVSIKFSKKGAFVIEGENASQEHIENLFQLGETIFQKHITGKWEREYVVISKIIKIENSTIIISNSKNSNIDLISDVDFSHGISDIGRTKTKVSLLSQSGDILKFIGIKNSTPLFQLSCLQSYLIGKTSFRTKSLSPENDKKGGLYFGLLEDKKMSSDGSIVF